jgi:hypothetical protein
MKLQHWLGENMAIDNFAVFILTHGRPDMVKTYDTLIKQGYTGPIYIIIDNEDETADAYKRRFGDKVIVFDKKAIAQKFDTGDNFQERRSVVFARNASFEIAKNLGIEYFLQLDDDYYEFRFNFSPSLQYQSKQVKNLDNLFLAMLKYYKNTTMASVAFGQGGDLFGGGNSSILSSVQTKRKCMNTFFCSTQRPFQFVGRVNEDVNTYVCLGGRGALMLSVFNAIINQTDTQSSEGGMTELYLNEGTYIKSFYTVMYVPSALKIGLMGENYRRLHHKISWDNAVPCILNERYKKSSRN